MSRRGENIYKRKDGRYEGRYKAGVREDGSIKYGYVYGHKYSEVKVKLSEHKALKTRRHTTAKSITVNDLAEAWLGAARIRVKESTYSKYVSTVQRHILPELGGMRAERLTTERLNELVRAKLDEGLCGGTVRGIVNLLCGIFAYGEKKLGLSNPTAGIVKPRHARGEIRVLQPDEWERLKMYTSHSGDFSKLGVLLSLYTGIRIGEVCALKVANLRLDHGLLRIEATMQRIQNTGVDKKERTKVVVGSPKSESSVRSIPLPRFLIEKLRSVYSGVSDKAYMLTGQVDKFLEPRVFQKRFKGYLRECGVRDVNFHALRHSFATRCVSSGTDVKALSEILGHSSVSVTLSKYVHISEAEKRRQMELLAAANE